MVLWCGNHCLDIPCCHCLIASPLAISSHLLTPDPGYQQVLDLQHRYQIQQRSEGNSFFFGYRYEYQYLEHAYPWELSILTAAIFFGRCAPMRMVPVDL